MEHSMSFGENRSGAGEDDEYDIEAQLAAAEHKYAIARERSRRARDECHALETDLHSNTGAIKRARERYEAADARRLALQRLIEEIEERLG